MCSAESEKIVFKFLGGSRKDESVLFQQPNISIGRAAGSDLLFDAHDDGMVSGHHAVVSHQDSDFKITDKRSVNGTFVNDNRTESIWLKSGDIIRLGQLGPELKVFIPSDISARTKLEDVPPDLIPQSPDPAPETPPEEEPPDPKEVKRILRQKFLRFVQKTMFAALGTAAGISGFAWMVIEALQLSPAPLYFKSVMSLTIGGVLVALVFTLYHGREGTQRYRVTEMLWIVLIVALSIRGVLLLWNAA